MRPLLCRWQVSRKRCKIETDVGTQIEHKKKYGHITHRNTQSGTNARALFFISTVSPLQREADDGAPATMQRRKAGSHLLPNATGGVRLGSTLLPGIAAGVAEPRMLRCVLCQVKVVIFSYARFRWSRPNCYNFAPYFVTAKK